MMAAGDLSGKTFLITGAGLLGATAILVSRFYGAKKIFVVEALEHRRLKAMELGASDAFPPGDLLRNVELPPIDVFLEFSGSNSAWEVGTRFLSTGGVAVLIGSVFPSKDASINLETVVRRMWTIRGVHNYGPRHLIRAVDFLTKSEIALSLTGLVGPWFAMGQYTEALEQAVKPETYRTGFLMDRK
jgi:threonine dehydrogenase-like Zn-dependent dehydrogenase